MSKRNRASKSPRPQPAKATPVRADPSALKEIPLTYQAINEYFEQIGEANPFLLRRETMSRIENITGRPLLCYVTKTHNMPPTIPSYIDDGDLVGFDDLSNSTAGINAVDVFLVSNGGSAEATERIIKLLRDRYGDIRFIVPANAYSAATLMCFAGNTIIMDAVSTLGPIDPQINGVPARAILSAFERVEAKLKDEGPQGLTAYMPLISKYDLHLLEICRSAEELSKELARNWLSEFMLGLDRNGKKIGGIVDFFSDYDIHRSHSRGIDRQQARKLGLSVTDVEEIDGLGGMVRSLYNQYELWFDKTPFYKMFEHAHGINWGRQIQNVNLQVPLMIPPGMPQPVPPQRTG